MGKPRKGAASSSGGKASKTNARAKQREHKFSEERFVEDLQNAVEGTNYIMLSTCFGATFKQNITSFFNIGVLCQKSSNGLPTFCFSRSILW